MFKRIIVEQLKNPSGLIGRYVLGAIWNRRNTALNDAALLRLNLKAEDRVLDVGFGGGYLIGRMLETVTQVHVSGVDASCLMVEQGCKRFASQLAAGSLDLRCAEVESLPYPDAHFNKVSSVNSLFYWPDLCRGIREIRRVLTADGLLVLAYTCKPDLDKQGFSPFGVRSFTDEELHCALQEEGFYCVHLAREGDKYRQFSEMSAAKKET